MGKYKITVNISHPEQGMAIVNTETMETYTFETRQDIMKIVTLLNKEA